MGNPKKFSTLESLAVLFALPGLLFGGIVVKVTIWPLPGRDNTMAVVIPYGLLSLGLAACFLVTAAIARLRWRWFVTIVLLWTGLAAIVLVPSYQFAVRAGDPSPVSIELRRIDTLDSVLSRPLVFLKHGESPSAEMRASVAGSEADRFFVVDGQVVACLVTAFDSESNGRADEGEPVLHVKTTSRSGSMTWGDVRRSRALRGLDAAAQCLDGNARDQVMALRSSLDTASQEASGNK